MSLIHIETYGRGKPVVLVHGWAMHSGIWRPFARQLAEEYRVTCVDLPGHGLSGKIDSFTLPAVCEQLAEHLPDQASHWLGWSLGGSVALEMARRFPGRVASVMLLASNPRFIEAHGWPGMAESALDAFARNLSADCHATLMRFLSLQIKGLPEFKELSRQLRQSLQQCDPPDSETLSAGLAVLKQTDLRSVLAALDKPILVVLGGRDTLVPAALGEALQNIKPELQLDIIDQAGHAPFLSHQRQLIDAMSEFLGRQ